MIRQLASRFDSIVNYLTGANDHYRDKGLAARVWLDAPLDVMTLQGLITGNDLAYRIVTSLPDKALKNGYGLAAQDGVLEPEVAQEQASEIIAACERLGLRDKLLEADSWGRGYGLGGIILGVTGAGGPMTPLDDDLVGQLSWMMVVDKREIQPESYYDSPTDEKFGEVEFYRITPTSQNGSITMVLHESRLIRFGGALTSRRERLANVGCDYSVLQRAMQSLRQTDANWSSACALMDDMSQSVYKIKGLWNTLASGGQETIGADIRNMDMMRSTRRSLVIDAEDEWERKATPMAGVNEMMEQSWKRLAAAAEMPLTVLMGVSPAGMNATGESDMRLWYDTVQSHREHVLAPRIERIVRLISRTLGHENPEAWKVTWPSLWQMTASEQAAYRFQVAQADNLYITQGVLLPEEVALSRFASGEEFDGATTTIDADARKAALDHALKAMEEPPEPPPVAPLPGVPKQGALPAMTPVAAVEQKP